MTTNAASLLGSRTIELLDQCAGFMRLGKGGTGLNLKPLGRVFEVPTHVDLMLEYLRYKVEEDSSKTLTVRRADPALFQWHLYPGRCLYLAICPFEVGEGAVDSLEAEFRLYQVRPGPGGLDSSQPAAGYRVGRNRARFRGANVAA